MDREYIKGIIFTNQHLLQIALTHRSFHKDYSENNQGLPSNERLEFLGDAVLNLLAATWLYEQFPSSSEGELSSRRSALVKMTTLARFAREIDLGHYVRVGRSEEIRNGRGRDSLLADVFEALLGAIYLDQGIEQARMFLQPFFEQETERILSGHGERDYRSLLQQLLQSKYNIVPTYQTIQVSGPGHRRQFTVEVLKGQESLGIGRGTSKQAAAQDAARVALETMT